MSPRQNTFVPSLRDRTPDPPSHTCCCDLTTLSSKRDLPLVNLLPADVPRADGRKFRLVGGWDGLAGRLETNDNQSSQSKWRPVCFSSTTREALVVCSYIFQRHMLPAEPQRLEGRFFGSPAVPARASNIMMTCKNKSLATCSYAEIGCEDNAVAALICPGKGDNNHTMLPVRI